MLEFYTFPSDISKFNQNSKVYLPSKREESDGEEQWSTDSPVYSDINESKPCYRISLPLDQGSENGEVEDDNNTDNKNVRFPLLLQKHTDKSVPEGYFLRRKWNFPQPYDREWDENAEEKEKEVLHKVLPGHFSQFNKKIKHKLSVNTPISDIKSENYYLSTDKLQKYHGSSNDNCGCNCNFDKNKQYSDKTEIDKNENCNKEMPEGYYLKMRFGDFDYRHSCGYGVDDDNDDY